MKVKYLDLKDKRVFISGGGSGIGASIVEHFCEQNSEVYFIDIDVKASNRLINNIKMISEIVYQNMITDISNKSQNK